MIAFSPPFLLNLIEDDLVKCADSHPQIESELSLNLSLSLSLSLSLGKGKWQKGLG